MKAHYPKVWIVVLNWNGLDDTLACLRHLQALDYPNASIVVIDNGSVSDEAAAIHAAFPRLPLIRNSDNRGYAGGSNQGIDYALKHQADYVLLLNNDTVPRQDFLDKMVAFCEQTTDAGPVSPLILYADRAHIWFAGGATTLGITRMFHKGELRSAATIPDQPFVSQFVPGTVMLLPVPLIKQIGPLDETLFAYYEDVDWGNRARAVGRQSYVVPGAIVYHKKSASTGKGGRHRFGKLPAYYLARNACLLARSQNLPYKIGYTLAQIFIKLPLSLLLLIQPTAWPSYVHGLLVGIGELARS